MSTSQNFPATLPSLSLDFANTKKLDPRITFARASTARVYDGKTVAKAEENLLLRSEEFDNAAWTKTNVTVTANQTTAPDGTSTADLLAETITNSFHLLVGETTTNRTAITSGQTYAFSVFLKKGTGATAPDIMQVSWGGAAGFAGNVYVNFNLDTGAVATAGAGALTSAITAAGGGWYRCSFTATATSTSTASTAVFFVENDGSATRAPSYAGATTADVFVWGAQLEQRSAVTAYTPTTTQPITNYIPVLLEYENNTARRDHNPVTGESLGLLVEEQRTNLFQRSEEFDNASWVKTAVTISSNTIVAPDGTLTGDKIVEDTTNAQRSAQQQNITTSTTTTSTTTFYAKAGERTVLSIRYGSQAMANRGQGNVDLTNGSTGGIGNIGSATGTTLSATLVGNGWYRIAISTNPNDAAATQMRLQIFLSNSTVTGVSGPTYTGDGYSGIYIWGAQLEASSTASTYIKTEASQVTRSADSASMTGANFSSWYRADQISFSLEYAWVGLKSVTPQRVFTVDDGSTSNSLSIGASSANLLATAALYNGSIEMNSTSPAQTFVANTFYRTAAGFAVNDSVAANNGAIGVVDTSITMPVNLSTLRFGATSAGVISNVYIKKFAAYPQRLSNANLQAITS